MINDNMRQSTESSWVKELLVPGLYTRRLTRVANAEDSLTQLKEYGKALTLAMGQVVLYIGGVAQARELCNYLNNNPLY